MERHSAASDRKRHPVHQSVKAGIADLLKAGGLLIPVASYDAVAAGTRRSPVVRRENTCHRRHASQTLPIKTPASR